MKFTHLLASVTLALTVVSSSSAAQTAKPGMMDSVSKQMKLGIGAAKSAKSANAANVKATRKPAVGDLVSGSEAKPAAKAAPQPDSSKSAPPIKRSAPVAKKKPPVK